MRLVTTVIISSSANLACMRTAQLLNRSRQRRHPTCPNHVMNPRKKLHAGQAAASPPDVRAEMWRLEMRTLVLHTSSTMHVSTSAITTGKGKPRSFVICMKRAPCASKRMHLPDNAVDTELTRGDVKHGWKCHRGSVRRIREWMIEPYMLSKGAAHQQVGDGAVEAIGAFAHEERLFESQRRHVRRRAESARNRVSTVTAAAERP